MFADSDKVLTDVFFYFSYISSLFSSKHNVTQRYFHLFKHNNIVC